jgi:septum formation protein
VYHSPAQRKQARVEEKIRRHTAVRPSYEMSSEVRFARIDEKAIPDHDPAQLTRKLAEAKAQKIAGECPDGVIVSGDAVASKDGKIFEKPCSKAEAAEFLKEFSGNEFQFVTSIAVLNAQTSRMLSTVETLSINFVHYSTAKSSSTSANTTS